MPNFTTQRCAVCFCEFKRTTKDSASARLKNCGESYCSRKCFGLSIQTKVTISCTNCQKQIYKIESQLRKSGNNFCSRSCAATYNNTHKTYGTRRSKLEVFLESQIREAYPNLKLLCNDKTAINSELDFYFPDLNLAIELNGILHFEPIYGHNKLDQIQSNDNKKAFLCNQNQINLAVLDTSMHKNCSQAVRTKFWSIVRSLLDSNMAEG